jgi:hypothetical protein
MAPRDTRGADGVHRVFVLHMAMLPTTVKTTIYFTPYLKVHGTKTGPISSVEDALVCRLQSAMPNRKGQYSCDFCRSRKLRCDRPLPCGNCVSRGKTCNFQPVPEQKQRKKQRPQAAQLANATANTAASPASTPAPAPHTPQYTPQPARAEYQQREGILADVRSLRKLAEDLERRVIQSTGGDQCDNERSTDLQLTSGPSPINLDTATTAENHSPSSVEKVGEFVAHLERVSMIPGRQVFTLLAQILLGFLVNLLCYKAYYTRR